MLDGLAIQIAAQSGRTVSNDAALAIEELAPASVRVPEQVVVATRERITEDIAHYSFRISTGPGQYDVIGMHRVVREEQSYNPMRTRKALFRLHGDLKDFEGMFLPGQHTPRTPDDFGIAAYLGQRGIDVWGMDQAWNLVPAEETDFSFMASWGLQRQIDDLEIGIAIDRVVRRMTGSGYDKMLLLGYSSGGITGYGLLHHEAQLPPGHRQVEGSIALV